MATITDFTKLFKSEISNKTSKSSIAPINFDNVFTKLSEVLTTINTQGTTNKKNVADLSASTITLSSSTLAIYDVTDYTDKQGVVAIYFWKPGQENVYYTGKIGEDGKIDNGEQGEVSSYNGEIIFDGHEKAIVLSYTDGQGSRHDDVVIDKETGSQLNGIIPIFDTKENLYKIKFSDMLITKITIKTV